MDSGIDFVLTWVDGSDPAWLESKKMYKLKDFGASTALDANSDCRYRDNGLLKYWFRGVEKFAPWVDHIHFVTCGQIPQWLNTLHPKLNLVNHSDFIPGRYLPTFNATTIEMNFHRIESLADKYVYFNDDMFIIKEVNSDLYFRNNYPVLVSDLRYTHKIGYNNWSRQLLNDYCVINSSFDMGKSIWDNREKWFSIKSLGIKQVRKNFLCYLANHSIPVGLYGHIALPHLKSTLQEVWDRHPDVLDTTCKHKFRSDDQVNQWLLCAWNQAKGFFYPTPLLSQGRVISISKKSLDWICYLIKNQAYSLVCLNDNEKTGELEQGYSQIQDALEFILPNKSKYEL